MNWLNSLKYNPIEPLVGSDNSAIIYFTTRDLLNKREQLINCIWDLPEVKKIIKGQMNDGHWKTKKKKTDTLQNYQLIETWKQLRFLVEKYEMNKNQQCIEKASGYIFSCQSAEGDIRGFLGNQYAAYYTGAVLGLLIKAGYENDGRVQKGIEWLLSVRQNDGGWIGSPLITLSWAEQIKMITKNRETLKQWDKAKPLCLNSTGMIIRAFASHNVYRTTQAAKTAAHLLKRNFFRENNYQSYKHKDHWLFFQFPYWWNNLVSALDSVSLIFPDKDDADIRNAVNWLTEHQEKNGLWKISYSGIHSNTQTSKTREAQLWITLVICRILKRLFGE